MPDLPEFLQPLTETSLGAEYLSAPVLSQHKSLESMAKQLVDFDRQRGEQIRVPGKEATDDDWKAFSEKLGGRGVLQSEVVQSAFLKSLGTPDDKDEYKLKPEEVPDGVTLTDERLAAWKDTFHKLKVPAKAATEIMNTMIAEDAAAGEAAAEAKAARSAAIEKEFGQALESNLSKVMNVAANYGGDDVVDFMKTADVPVLKMMVKLAEQFDVQGDGEFNSEGVRVMISPLEAKAQLDEVNKKLMDTKIVGDERNRLMDESVRLNYLAMGEKPKETLALTR